METQNKLTTVTAQTSIAHLPGNNLCNELFKVNQLVSFPINEFQIEDWSVSLKKLAPDLKLIDLQKIFDKFMMNKIKWNDKQGIQNIFAAIEIHKADVIAEWDAKFYADCNKCYNSHESINHYYDEFKQEQGFLNYLVKNGRINNRHETK